MLRILSVIILSTLVAASGYAQDAKKVEKTTVTGYIVDAMCAKGMAKKENPMEKAAMHTKQCALEEACAASGFGVFSDGKWHKFDKKGDELALALIKESKTEKGMIVEVEGMQKDDVLAVASIKEQMQKK
jgi:hypothetical protein